MKTLLSVRSGQISFIIMYLLVSEVPPESGEDGIRTPLLSTQELYLSHCFSRPSKTVRGICIRLMIGFDWYFKLMFYDAFIGLQKSWALRAVVLRPVLRDPRMVRSFAPTRRDRLSGNLWEPVWEPLVYCTELSVFYSFYCIYNTLKILHLLRNASLVDGVPVSKLFLNLRASALADNHIRNIGYQPRIPISVHPYT